MRRDIRLGSDPVIREAKEAPGAQRRVLGLVDVCLNNDFRVQITPDRRRAAQLRKENPIRLWCSPRPSASSADKKVFFATLRVTSRIS